MKTVTITKRNRNLGYGWSNTPVQRHGFGLGIDRPTEPTVVGGPRTVLIERARARKLNSGNDWQEVLFVGGKPIIDLGATDDFVVGWFPNHGLVREVLYWLMGHGHIAVVIEDAE